MRPPAQTAGEGSQLPPEPGTEGGLLSSAEGHEAAGGQGEVGSGGGGQGGPGMEAVRAEVARAGGQGGVKAVTAPGQGWRGPGW